MRQFRMPGILRPGALTNDKCRKYRRTPYGCDNMATPTHNNESLSQSNAALTSQLRHFESDLEGIRAELERRANHNTVLGSELRAARVESHALLAAHAELATQNTALIDQVAALEAKLAKSRGRRFRKWMRTALSLSMSEPGGRRQARRPTLAPLPHSQPSSSTSSTTPKPTITKAKGTSCSFLRPGY